MTGRSTRIIIFGILAALICAVPFAAKAVNAQTAGQGAAQGLEISPALVQTPLLVKGTTYTIKLNVTNVTASDLVYKASVDDFAAKDESGTPQILVDSKLPPSASIKTWVSTPDSFSLKSHESRTITADITVPSDAEPGGHYGVLKFSGGAPQVEQTGVGLSASAGVLLLVRVDGLITEKASVASFYTANSDKQTSFFEKSPITFVTRIKNEGNIHVEPVGSIELRDTFGNLVKTMPVNNDKSNVLPNSIRRFDTTFDTGWMMGHYTANLTLGYGSTGQAITATTSFWVIPYKLLLVVILVIVTLVYVLSRLVKSYNKRIIAKAKNENSAKNKKRS